MELTAGDTLRGLSVESAFPDGKPCAEGWRGGRNGFVNEIEGNREFAKAGPGISPSGWVEAHGDCLYRYALARVRQSHVAEDLVQDTFVVALRGSDRFAGRSSERSWLVGILKHKIIDHYRRMGRETSFTDLEFLKDEFSHKFDSEGYWDHDLGPGQWKSGSDAVVHREEFWRVMKGCLDKLPQRVGEVFMLREMEEMPAKEICGTLGISDSNFWVMMHRARMALRECLEMNWFAPEESR